MKLKPGVANLCKTANINKTKAEIIMNLLADLKADKHEELCKAFRTWNGVCIINGFMILEFFNLTSLPRLETELMEKNEFVLHAYNDLFNEFNRDVPYVMINSEHLKTNVEEYIKLCRRLYGRNSRGFAMTLPDTTDGRESLTEVNTRFLDGSLKLLGKDAGVFVQYDENGNKKPVLIYSETGRAAILPVYPKIPIEGKYGRMYETDYDSYRKNTLKALQEAEQSMQDAA